jgi:hypothetical protein
VSNVVQEPGFEDSAPWQLFSNASIGGAEGVHGGAAALVLPIFRTAGGIVAQGEGRQSVTLVPGLAYQGLAAWVKWKGGSTYPLRFQLDDGSGILSTVLTVPTSDMPEDTFTRVQVVGTHLAVGAAGRVSWLGFPAAGQSAFEVTTWVVDDVELDDGSVVPSPEDVVAFRKWLVAERLRDKLLTIQGAGAGYWTTLGDRVFYNLIYPHEDGAPRDPYVCIPFDGSAGPLPVMEHRSLKLTWPQPIYAFAPNPNEELLDRSGELARRTADLEDDLVRALMSPDVAFGDLVKDSRLLPIVPHAGEDPEFHWGQVNAVVEFDAIVQHSNLGPGGV